ncbi:605_t:CDS:2 [Paraglomus brasilianum]|uniref:605_t:CDS:1 n=1 Tax=Paraglomus brasilianum TaxID=144538 RepID=A0A9N9GXN4_9GLOM|nr:605_t:CDS:2 [Paraglomus brasilianum]
MDIDNEMDPINLSKSIMSSNEEMIEMVEYPDEPDEPNEPEEPEEQFPIAVKQFTSRRNY